MMDALSLASTDDLITELKTRFDDLILAGLRDTQEEEKGKYYGKVFILRTKGQYPTCVGLCQRINHELLTDWSEDGVTTTPDDEEEC